MPGGLMQLTAYGAQDMYLTGTPDITFFKMVYRRYTNFSYEYIEQTFSTLPTFTTMQNTIAKCKIERNGDLMHDVYLVYDLPALFSFKDEPVGWSTNVGNDLIYTATITAAGAKLDMRYGRWMTIWNELTLSDSKIKSYRDIIGNSKYTSYSGYYHLPDKEEDSTLVIPSKRLYIPLGFWFCINPGLSIPLVALQYTEIFIIIEYNPLNHIFRLGNPLVSPEFLFSDSNNLSEFNKKLAKRLRNEILEGDTSKSPGETYRGSFNEQYGPANILFKYAKGWKQNSYLLVNYIYLSDDERTRFAKVSHEYLITQTQTINYSGLITGRNTLNISTLNHPVKEFVWVLQDPDVSDNNDWSNYTLIHNVNDSRMQYSYDYIKQLDMETLSKQFNKINQHSVDKELSSEEVKKFMKSLFYNINNDSLRYPSKIDQSFNNYRDIMNTGYLMFNGIDRFSVQEKEFFSGLQKFQYHTNTGLPGTYVYSFALHPENEKPSGTCNMSRLNNADLIVNIVELSPIKKYNLFLFAINYNIFRIAAGIGAPVFAP
jgi:hypothetical protein